MIIEKYGIRLERLTSADLELVRNKRNQDSIRKKMIFQDIITEEQQKAWFESIDTIHHLYFIVSVDGLKIGLVNGKNTDFVNRVSEGGIFIWDENHLYSIIPSYCSIIMHDYNFLICEFEKTVIKVLKSNLNAIQFNKTFGYELVSETDDFGIYQLKRERYLQKIEKFRKAIGHATGDAEPLGESDFSFSNVSDEELKRLYLPLPVYLREKANLILKKENRNLLSLNQSNG